MVSMRLSSRERTMDTILCEIAKKRIIRDVNNALTAYGLSVTSLEFDSSVSLSVIIKLKALDVPEEGSVKNIAVPEGTAC